MIWTYPRDKKKAFQQIRNSRIAQAQWKVQVEGLPMFSVLLSFSKRTHVYVNFKLMFHAVRLSSPSELLCS